MISEKPSWINHGGTQIFSIDIQPGGLRFATGGGDHKVRIWNMTPVGRELLVNDSVPKLLATLRDHFGSVNCVRWAKQGRFIASGSDDQVILIHERKPGSGTTEFGSGEAPDVENWKVVMTLRGHTADVVDLNWSSDDSTLASGSLDNTIHVWDMSNGICTAVLRGHTSLVKGVTWDPIGSFIASQSDDKTVIFWRTSDWSMAHRTDGHWNKSLGSTFFRRLDWSPCGHFITTTHGFQKPRHSAPVLERGEWSATFDFLGHSAPIIVVRFNPVMFRMKPLNSNEFTGRSNGNGSSSKDESKDLQPYNVIAIGSQDRTITLWTTTSPRPLFVAKSFFSQSVVDLSWSPDGYSLFVCSLDGTVATYHFDVNEIGHKLTDSELEDLKRNRYGDVRGRKGNLAETPAQLLLEAASTKKITSKKTTPVAPKNRTPIKPPEKLAISTKTNKRKAEDSTSDKLNKRLSPVKQKEYMRPDGRRRIIPEPVGVIARQETSLASAHFEVPEIPNGAISNTNRVSLQGSICKPVCGSVSRATISESLLIEKVPGKEGSSNNVEQMGRNTVSSGVLMIRVFDKKEGDGDMTPFCLEARPRELPVNDVVVGAGNTLLIKETQLSCTKGGQIVWSDGISAKVTVLAGNSNFWAVGCEDGSLQVYTKCGRRAMPTMMMGSSPVFIDCDESWKLLVVTQAGSLYVWDLFNKKCLLHDSLASLIAMNSKDTTGTIKVISAKLSKSGLPLVVLATRHAYLFDTSLMCWLRVADDCFPASNFASSWNSGSAVGGELAALQVDVRKYLARKPGWSRVTDDGVQTRAHLESQMASALSLKSPNEYRQSLLSYIRFLTREGDQSRLREVCESFLGPPIGMAESGPSDLKTLSWDPLVLGMAKHKLLREDILPAMASNRSVQRLLNEFIDLLSEYNTNENLPKIDEMDTDPPEINNKAFDLTLVNQENSAEQNVDIIQQIANQTVPPASVEMDTDSPLLVQMDSTPVPAVEGMVS